MLALVLSLALVSPEPVSHAVPQNTAASDVSGYWTSDRMGSARPVAPRKGSPLRAIRATGAPTALARTVTPLSIRGTKQPRSVGKVFFTMGGRDYSCSASVVNSRGRNLLATAAHCVYDAKRWAKNWIFIPGYSYSRGKHLRPYGVWTMTKAVIEPEWARSYDPDYDYAFVTVGKYRGRNVANVVGAQGIRWNQPAKVSVLIYGYPAEYPWNGSRVVGCSRTTELDTVPAARVARHRFARCTLNGGSSGGPWIRNYSSATGTGYLVGVQSMKWMNSSGVTTWNSSPYLGDRAYKLYLKLGR
ncbi:trypsin-like serine peptidase [Planobispora longispora]|uniref:Peptidase n=1 Tax=Planobispora longispora TaxID=28887 RepID=A0A8J3RLT8_9ACTN|nr:trypsin-like peptidase domain-containing protein [Planobispora longispora]GIH76491.1 peptidase [Planobispora longispora]